jgi:hypothetical protein
VTGIRDPDTLLGRDMHTRATPFVLALVLSACDVAREPTPRGGDLPGPGDLAPTPEPIRPSRRDCRDAHYCYRDCLGPSFLAGELAVDHHDECAEACEPEVDPFGTASTELDHWSWWISAVEVQCEDDWSDACLWQAIVPDLYGTDGDLSGTVLDGCLRPRW